MDVEILARNRRISNRRAVRVGRRSTGVGEVAIGAGLIALLNAELNRAFETVTADNRGNLDEHRHVRIAQLDDVEQRLFLP